jgi:hypothetical protein
VCVVVVVVGEKCCCCFRVGHRSEWLMSVPLSQTCILYRYLLYSSALSWRMNLPRKFGSCQSHMDVCNIMSMSGLSSIMQASAHSPCDMTACLSQVAATAPATAAAATDRRTPRPRKTLSSRIKRFPRSSTLCCCNFRLFQDKCFRLQALHQLLALFIEMWSTVRVRHLLKEPRLPRDTLRLTLGCLVVSPGSLWSSPSKTCVTH